MKRALCTAMVILVPVSMGTLVACGDATSAPSPPSPAGPAASPGAAPPAPTPAVTSDCPYLDTEWVADTNGQHVTSVRISSTEGGSPPSCFFYRPDGGLQVAVRVYQGNVATARAIVDLAAPVSTSDPADQPAGWQGGYQTTNPGAVYAVAKNGDAVVVNTNQAQSIKAREIAMRTIAALKL